MALLVTFPDAEGRQGDDVAEPELATIAGDPDTLGSVLRAFAAEGVGHVQLVLDPITVGTIEALAPTISAVRGGD